MDKNDGAASLVCSDALFGIWFDTVPPHTHPGTKSDYFLAVGIDSDVPQVLVYMHDERVWTAGGGDTQRVRLWGADSPVAEQRVIHKENQRPAK